MKSAIIAIAAALIASALTWLFTGQGQGSGGADVEGLQAQVSEIAAQLVDGGDGTDASVSCNARCIVWE